MINEQGYEDVKDWIGIKVEELENDMKFKPGHAKMFMRKCKDTFGNMDDGKSKDDNDSEVVEDEEYYLEMRVKVWKSIFDHVINPTIDHVEKLLKMPVLSENCKYLCLVGGLSCSPYFQSRMRMRFGKESEYKLDLIIPKPSPILAVVRGAAYFGITDNYIRARVLKRSYGVAVTK